MAPWKRRDGQALVETALVLPLLLLLLVGIAEVGWLISRLLALQHGGYDLARMATVNATDAEILARAQAHAERVVGSPPAVSTWYGTDGATGKTVLYARFERGGEWVQLELLPAAADRLQGDLVRAGWTWGYRPIFVGWLLPARTMSVQATGRAELPLE